nr:hypothetical protein [Bacteroidota bacterium]
MNKWDIRFGGADFFYGKEPNVSFAREQIRNSSGGPPDVNLLYDLQLLKDDFCELKIEKICQEMVNLNEGHHHGVADVIRMTGRMG